MVKGSTVAVGLGAAALVGIAAFYFIGQAKGGIGKYLLQTTAGTGGNITPSSASGIYEPAGSQVTITIQANNGYTIGQILEDGNPINTSTTETNSTFQVTMNMNHEIDVTFYQGGQPPTGAPVSIQALNTQTVVWGYYGCKIGLGAANSISSISIQSCDAKWDFAAVQFTYIKFKVVDANGNGVPGVTVALYPNLFPDGSKYEGYLSLNAIMANQSAPLILTTGSDGTVTPSLSYFCNPAAINGPNELPYDAGLYVNYTNEVPPFYWSFHPYNGWNPGPAIFVGKGGQGITGQGPAAMGPMQPNTVTAQIPGTSIPPAQCLCSCGFNIKML